MTLFAFLKPEWPAVHEAAVQAATAANSDPRTACFHARRALELAVAWAYKHDPALKLPYQDNLSALIHEPSFKQVVGEAVFSKARVLVTLGNRAVHSDRAIPVGDALVAVRELFHVAYWFARTYARGARPAPGLAFDPAALPKPTATTRQTADQLLKLQTEVEARDEKLAALFADKTALDEELKRLRAEVAQAKKDAAEHPDTHDYSEAETRDYFIDLLLKEAGWPLDQPRDREFEVPGMPNTKGLGYVDYVLWGDDGKPLGLVEAKRTRRDPRVGQHQAKLYADCLEQQFGQRPVIFYSNGYDHWLWDDTNAPPRSVQGFLKKAELELSVQRRESRRPLATASINPAIAERYYQTRAIRRIGEAFEKDNERKALVVMATGAGKTRTVVALCDLLIRCNWVKRVLFLADRIELVKQAVGAFKRHLPDASPVNLVTEKEGSGRVFVSTYQSMMKLIDDSRDGQRRFGVGHFDLVIIDEAHRSVHQKYRAIFNYFDSLLVGLTATPREDIDRNTYSLFDLESGVPTDNYTLGEAISDGFLVPARGVSVPIKFQREGIKYADLSDEEKDQWDALEWDDDGTIPALVEPPAVNKWLFNQDTVDQVLEHLMTHGLTVAGGDRLGKTILFAKNQAHANFIAQRFDANYPHHRGEFARVITHEIKYVGDLIDDFKVKEKAPHLALSVDMLDTGIDVPEVVNLVFFKVVHSKTKFWQMVGRGTRLCPDLFGPGQDKECFYIFDYCGNLEYFGENPPTVEGKPQESLGKKLFVGRLDLIGELDHSRSAEGGEPIAKLRGAVEGDSQTDKEVRQTTSERLQREVAAMNVANFVVRPRRRFVEKYARPEAWEVLSAAARTELEEEVAGLPSELDAEAEEAKRFDWLILNLQLARLRAEPRFERLKDRVQKIAGLLEEKSAIPRVREQMVLIEELQTDEWWQDVTVPMLEIVRLRLRELIRLIEKAERKLVYTDFEDELGEAVEIGLPAFGEPASFAKFRAKAQAFLRAHQDHITVHKLRMNRALTDSDLVELERMLVESGIGGAGEINRAKTESNGLGLFVRSLVGLDREAAKEALGGFLTAKTHSANQIEFANLIVDHLTDHGVMAAERLYESPFTDLSPRGPEEMFSPEQVDELMDTLDQIRRMALAA